MRLRLKRAGCPGFRLPGAGLFPMTERIRPCGRPPTGRPPRAFTLVEFLVALFLVLVIAAAGGLLFGALDKAWFKGETAVATHTEARALVAFLNRYVSTAVLPGEWPGGRPEFIGAPQEMIFCALAPGTADRTDFALVRFTFDHPAEMLRVVMNRVGEPVRDFTPPVARGAQPVSFSVKTMSFSYHDGPAVHDYWDSRAGAAQADRLPEAVQVRFELYGPRRRRGERPAAAFDGFFEIKTAVGNRSPGSLK